MKNIQNIPPLWEDVSPLGIRAKLNNFPCRLLASRLGTESIVQQKIFKRKKTAINDVHYHLFE